MASTPSAVKEYVEELVKSLKYTKHIVKQLKSMYKQDTSVEKRKDWRHIYDMLDPLEKALYNRASDVTDSIAKFYVHAFEAVLSIDVFTSSALNIEHLWDGGARFVIIGFKGGPGDGAPVKAPSSVWASTFVSKLKVLVHSMLNSMDAVKKLETVYPHMIAWIKQEIAWLENRKEGCSQEEVAKRLGIHHFIVGSFVAGVNPIGGLPLLDTGLKMLETKEISPNEFDENIREVSKNLQNIDEQMEKYCDGILQLSESYDMLTKTLNSMGGCGSIEKLLNHFTNTEVKNMFFSSNAHPNVNILKHLKTLAKSCKNFNYSKVEHLPEVE